VNAGISQQSTVGSSEFSVNSLQFSQQSAVSACAAEGRYGETEP
jgi:hypothetical protein